MPNRPPFTPVQRTAKVLLGWVLGHDRFQRLCIRFLGLTSSVYLCLVALLWYAADIGLAHPVAVPVVTAVIFTGLTFFYVLLRSGFSQRLKDRSLTAAQMVFAFFALAVCYLLLPQLRLMLAAIMPLTLTFGAFTFPLRQCRQLGWLAISFQGVAVTLAWLSGVMPAGPEMEAISFLSSAIVLLVTAEVAGRLSELRQQLRDQKRSLNAAVLRNELLARQDVLTGLPNRRHADEMLLYEERRAPREWRPTSVCIFDIDHFKRINDTYGHPAGDQVLRWLATHCQKLARGPDLLARWGGEEFILVMPQTPTEDALMVVERIRQAVAKPEVWAERPELQVTFSSGLATWAPGETMAETVARADAALYGAKHRGRNCTVVADLPLTKPGEIATAAAMRAAS